MSDSSHPEQEHNSISVWISGLKEGDADAARRLWERYSHALMVVARTRLGDAPRRVADEEDVALSAFATLCRRAADGEFRDLANRNDLWWLLLTITRRKAVSQIRRDAAAKRRGDASTVALEETADGPSSPPHAIPFDEIVSDEPTPEYLAILSEEYERILNLLRDDALRSIAAMRIEGHSVKEIAARLGISSRSVDRKLALIRKTWAREVSVTA